jgi:hypothetical protein
MQWSHPKQLNSRTMLFMIMKAIKVFVIPATIHLKVAIRSAVLEKNGLTRIV